MNPMRMLVENLWDSAEVTVATGTEVATLPLAHSQTYGRSKTAAITPSADTSVIEFELDNITLASGFVMYRHWLSTVAQWRLQLYADADQTGDLVYDSTLVDAIETKTLGELDWLVDPLVSSVFDNWPFAFSQLWFDGVFFRSGRLTIVDSQARDGIHEFDRIYLGRVFEPQFNFSYGHTLQWLSNTTQRKTAAGSVFAASRQAYRQISWQLEYLLDSERPHLSEALRLVGLDKDLFISLFPEQGGLREIEYAMSCKLTENPAIAGNFFNNNTTAFSAQEA